MSELRGSNRAADTVANTARDAAPDCAVNAFSTRRIRPGQLAYRFADGLPLETLVLRLETHGYWGEIVGPHGSGKSTLLEHLLPLCEDRGKVVDRFQFRTDQRQLSVSDERRRSWNASTLVVVDGYEQLSWWNRWRLKRWCRQAGAGLLVTAHRTMGLPRLHKTSTSLELLRTLVSELVRESPEAWRPSDTEVSEAYRAHGGNLREALLQLYDDYQRRQQAADDSSRGDGISPS
jgi:energy-coupling factor transporter ATP-binding protein EcfA2